MPARGLVVGHCTCPVMLGTWPARASRRSARAPRDRRSSRGILVMPSGRFGDQPGQQAMLDRGQRPHHGLEPVHLGHSVRDGSTHRPMSPAPSPARPRSCPHRRPALHGRGWPSTPCFERASSTHRPEFRDKAAHAREVIAVGLAVHGQQVGLFDDADLKLDRDDEQREANDVPRHSASPRRFRGRTPPSR